SRPVTAQRLGAVAGGEPGGEGVLVDPAVLAEHLEDANRHRGVVGPRPRHGGGGLRVVLDTVPVLWVEARLAEGVADGQPVEGERGAVHSGSVVAGKRGVHGGGPSPGGSDILVHCITLAVEERLMAAWTVLVPLLFAAADEGPVRLKQEKPAGQRYKLSM